MPKQSNRSFTDWVKGQGYAVEQGYSFFTDGETGQRYAVRNSTGEVTRALEMEVVEGSYVVTPEQQEAAKRRRDGLLEKLEQEEQKRFRNENLKELGKYYFFAVCKDFAGLSDASVARLVFLATFLSLESGRLYKTERIPLKLDHLPELMGLHRKTVKSFLKEVDEYLAVDDDNGLIMIGDVFIRGELPKGQHIAMQRLYRNSIRNIYRITPVSKHHLLGLVFRLLPYVNQEYNILCRNPGEECIDDLELLSLHDFCELIGHDYLKMYRLKAELRKLTFDVNGKQELFCNFVDTGLGPKHIRIFINPHIMYNGSDYKKVEVLGKFCEL